MNLEAIAHAAHEANRAFCRSRGDDSQPPWDSAPEWQRKAALAGIETALSGADARKQHEAWCAVKLQDGWRHGPIKDAAKKEHPMLVDYDELPRDQQIKDTLYGSIVNAMAKALRALDG